MGICVRLVYVLAQLWRSRVHTGWRVSNVGRAIWVCMFELLGSRNLQMQVLCQKRPIVRYLFNNLAGGLPCSMAGAGFDADQHRRIAGLVRLHSGGKFKTVSGKHAVIMIGG